MTTIYPVIMCGGAGTRLWPISRQDSPKQYHALMGEHTLLEDTVKRVSNMSGADGINIAPPSFVSAGDHEELIKSQCKTLGVSPLFMILEPFGRNTAPVAAMVSMVIGKHDPDGLVLLLPADHYIKDTQTFWERVKDGIAPAQGSKLVTFGIHPTSPHTGYGYIQRGEELGENAFSIERFVEKPALFKAKTYLSSGDFFWNAGIFLFSTQSMLTAFEHHSPQFIAPCAQTLAASNHENGRIALNAEKFEACPSDSIDFAIMEKADNVAVVAPVDIGWNDIGSWPALYDLLVNPQEPNGNVKTGEVIALDCQNSLLRSDGPLIAGIGLENMIVIATKDAILVLPKERAQEVKSIIKNLKDNDRTDLL